jgi:hypothetical protein
LELGAPGDDTSLDETPADGTLAADTGAWFATLVDDEADENGWLAEEFVLTGAELAIGEVAGRREVRD